MTRIELDPRERRALAVLLCRPSPPLLPAEVVVASASLEALQEEIEPHPTELDRVSRLQDAIEAWCDTEGASILRAQDAAYPELLRHIARPPLALFLRGDPRWLAEPGVAIVGARACSAAARHWTHDLAAELTTHGIAVYSGLARGIDAAAHRGALSAGGITVAVQGCGPDVFYPPENATLQTAIAERGCVLTELPPGTPPLPWHFPLRNRILSGLVSGVVVVQAEMKSGALVTARQALDENREVLAVPGDVTDPRSRGPHHLLRQGAALVECAADVLEAIGWLAIAAESAEPQPASTPHRGHDARTLLGSLGQRADTTESLRVRLGWAPERLQRVLAQLELAGWVRLGPGGEVHRTRDAKA